MNSFEATGRVSSLRARLIEIENRLHRLLVRHSIPALRIALGVVFLGFGLLKFFPGVSPAQELATTTIDVLTIGLVPEVVARLAIATLECFIGICFLAGRWMRLAVWLLALQLVGVLLPLVLLTGRLFSGPSGAPTLEGQYVLKDIVLVGAAMVIAAAAFRGGRLVRDEPSAPPATAEAQSLDAHDKLAIVLSAADSDRSVDDVCAQHGISPAAYYEWRDAVTHAATRALDETSNGTGASHSPGEAVR